MINIIKPGYLKEAQCPKCGAVLSYDENEDVETRYEKGVASSMETYRKPVKYITCPQCKNEIVLKEVEEKVKPIQIVIHDHSGEELYSELSYLSSMIPIRQERRGNAIGISDGLIRPVIIIGKYGCWNKLAGLRPDFWIAGDDDCRAMLTLAATKVGGVELNRMEDVLKIVEILRVEEEDETDKKR